MPGSSITRSVNGCLTCKNRKKKCDETRPVCTRCINGDFECLGYDYLDLPKGPRRRRKKAPGAPRPSNSPASIASSTPSFCLPAHNPPEVPAFHHSAVTPPTHAIVQIPQVNELNPDHIVQMFIFYSQQTPNAVQPFKPFHFSVLGAITDRIRSSILTLRSAYVEARIKKAVVDGAGLSIGVQLIDNFQRQITNTRAIPDMNPADVATHINSLFSLAFYTMHILNTPIAYSIIRKTVPFFLALAAKSQELWTEDLSISIRHALANPNVAITHFVFLDTVIALVLGLVPLIHYDSALGPMIPPPEQSYIEWAHGCSAIVITLLARINSWRATRFADPGHPAPTPEYLQEFQACLHEWNPTLEYGDEPAVVMGRLAVQEIWKHAVLIYMYMGMCEVNSADRRVEASVRQVAQLSATIEAGHHLEAHIPIPCIIAGAAARKEKHRAILRKKIATSRNERICLVRGADFVLVLDHLWHGAAVGGRPTTWQDYVDSRFAVLPVGL